MDELVVKENNSKELEDDKEGSLPGFRFHPTDEELVGFYLKRKVEKKPLRIEIIKQIDIYKYDPWDLPKEVSNVGEKEWYFFCIRGRKYRNSIRPNRVTGSGFWKATGIDKPIYSVKEGSGVDHHHDSIIGLKKSLVYYRGSAGKGTKTDWMMHEFRLPPTLKTTSTSSAATHNNNSNLLLFPTPNKDNINTTNNNHNNSNAALLEAEVWTLCRIFKRIPSYKKYVPADHNKSKESTATTKKSSSTPSSLLYPLEYYNHYNNNDSSSKSCSLETHDHPSLELDTSMSDHHHHQYHRQAAAAYGGDETTPTSTSARGSWFNNIVNVPHITTTATAQPPFSASYSTFNLRNPNSADEFSVNESWDDLRSVVQLAVDRHSSQLYDTIK